MDESTKTEFRHWAHVEVMGHESYAGEVMDASVGGATFIRVDVPEVLAQYGGGTIPAFTKLFAPGAIFSISPCTEQVARETARRLCQRPIRVYEPAAAEFRQRRLEAPEDDDWDDE